jgi:hypothetical protein
VSGILDALRACCKFKGCVGEVDAEKLAQRSSVAAWVLSCWSAWVWCHLNSPRCFPPDWVPLLNLFTGLRLVAGRFDGLLCRLSGHTGISNFRTYQHYSLYRFHTWLISLSNHLYKWAKVLTDHFYKRMLINARWGCRISPSMIYNRYSFIRGQQLSDQQSNW